MTPHAASQNIAAAIAATRKVIGQKSAPEHLTAAADAIGDLEDYIAAALRNHVAGSLRAGHPPDLTGPDLLALTIAAATGALVATRAAYLAASSTEDTNR
jgi:hypothetical protein